MVRNPNYIPVFCEERYCVWITGYDEDVATNDASMLLLSRHFHFHLIPKLPGGEDASLHILAVECRSDSGDSGTDR